MSGRISARKLPESLTKDKEVISSMKAIQRAGFWAFITALFTPFLLVSALGSLGPIAIIYPIMAIYLGYSGSKLNRLEGDIKTMLTINLIIGLLLITGIFPIILVVTSIIALVKIKSYNIWQNKDEPGTKQQNNMNNLEQDRAWRVIKTIFVIIATVLFIAICGSVYGNERQKCSYYGCADSSSYGAVFGSGIVMLIIFMILYFFILPMIYKYIQYGRKDDIKKDKL